MVILQVKKQFLLLLNRFLVVAEFGLGLLRDRLLLLVVLVNLERSQLFSHHYLV
ncbi:hypothetical protein [Nostoc sp.]|uniref:hypothetical protein n=1 Tax=Nostoc sp. TaxID=1180 RepID=UPI002FF44F89